MGNRKCLKRADRTYKDLKQKQKAKIADSMFEKTCDYYREHGSLPEGEDCEKIAGQIYQRVREIWRGKLKKVEYLAMSTEGRGHF